MRVDRKHMAVDRRKELIAALATVAAALLGLVAVRLLDLVPKDWEFGEIVVAAVVAIAFLLFAIYWIYLVVHTPKVNTDNILSSWSLKDSFYDSLPTSFNGRDWIFDAINEWGSLGHSLLLLIGPAGMGKTEIARELVRRMKSMVVAYHFCDHRNLRTLGAIDFVRSLAAMLAKNVPAYSALLRRKYRPAVEALDSDDAWKAGIGSHIRRVIREPFLELQERRHKRAGFRRLTKYLHRLSKRPADAEIWWIVVDALDETTGAESRLNPEDGGTVCDALRQCLAELPQGLRVIATTRADRDVLDEELTRFITVQDKIVLEMPDRTSPDLERNQVTKDTRAYVDRLLIEAARQDPKLANALKDPNHARHIQETLDFIVRESRGNFLLTKLNFEQFMRNPLSPIEKKNFANDFEHRYRLTFDRLFKGREAKYTSTFYPFLAAVLVSEERQPLSEEALIQLAGTDPHELRRLRGQLDAFLPKTPQGKIVTFHKSFSDWLISDRAGPSYKIDKSAGERLLTNFCRGTLESVQTDLSAEAIDLRKFTNESDVYLRSHGIDHFLASKPPQFGDAIRLVHLLLNAKEGEEKVWTRQIPAPHLARKVLLALDKCSDTAAKQINPDHLADLLIDVYQIEPLPAALKILVKHHYEQFSKSHMGKDPDKDKQAILKRFLDTENYVLRYEISNVLGDECAVPNSPINHQVIREYMCHDDINYRELGRYALRRCYVNPSNRARIDVPLLIELAEDDTYVGPQVLGETLLNLALQKRSFAAQIDQSDRSLLTEQRMIWEHNLQNVWDLRAVDAFRSGGDPELLEANEKATYRHLAETERLRTRLATNSMIEGKSIQAVLDSEVFYALGGDPTPLKAAELEIRGLDPVTLRDLMYLLFAHVSWNVGETAASILGSIFEMDRDSAKSKYIERELIRGLWTDRYDWRIHLGAIETAYIVIGINQELFTDAVNEFYDHTCCRVRGLCAENLITHILHQPSTNWVKELKRREIRKYLDYWLLDDDCWVLEHVFGLLAELHAAGENCDSIFGPRRSRLLEDLPLSEWAALSRGEFLKRIERKKRQRTADRQLATAG